MDRHERGVDGRQRQGSRDRREHRILVPGESARKGSGEVRRPSGILRDCPQAHGAHRVVRVGGVRLRRGSQAQRCQLPHHEGGDGDRLRLAPVTHGYSDSKQREGTLRHHARARPGEVPVLGTFPGHHARRRG